MSQSHKKNHYVPKFMLKHWLVQQDGFRGVHVHLVNEGRTTFERVGRKARNPYSFAIVEDLYVPLVDDRRAVGMEKEWLQGMEAVMARVVRQAHARQDVQLRSSMDLTKFKMSLFALEVRSRAVIKRIEELVEADPELRKEVTANPERNTDRIVLENMIHIVTELSNRHSLLEFNFIHAGERSFVIGDRPCFTADELGHFAVLTNKVAVRHAPSTTWGNYSNHIDAPPDIVDMINGLVALQARDWLVADSRPLLDRYAAVVGTPEWHESWENVRVELLPPSTLSSGWSITE